MATVSDIREIRGLVEISLDGVAWLKIRKKHFSKRPLKCGDEVAPDAYLEGMAAVQAADCYEAALTMLDQAAKTEGEMRRKLLAKGYVSPAAEATVARLAKNRLIDDKRIAERMAQIQREKPVGVYALKRKLKAKQLSDEDIEAALEGFDDRQQAQACRAAAEKLKNKYRVLEARAARAKLSQALARRGFSWDAISGAVDEALSGMDDFDE